MNRTCSDERPCINCFSDQGDCLGPYKQKTHKEKDVEAVRNLPHQGSYKLLWCEDGGGIVFHLYGKFHLYYCPQYGAAYPQFERTYDASEIEALVDKAHEWS